jgi:hypothetical protein
VRFVCKTKIAIIILNEIFFLVFIHILNGALLRLLFKPEFAALSTTKHCQTVFVTGGPTCLK